MAYTPPKKPTDYPQWEKPKAKAESEKPKPDDYIDRPKLKTPVESEKPKAKKPEYDAPRSIFIPDRNTVKSEKSESEK